MNIDTTRLVTGAVGDVAAAQRGAAGEAGGIAQSSLARHIQPFATDGFYDPHAAMPMWRTFQGPIEARLSSYGAGVAFGDKDFGKFFRTLDWRALLGVTISKLDERQVGKGLLKTSGLFQQNGQINPAVKASFDAAFEANGGTMTPKQFNQVLDDMGVALVGRRQFKSFYLLCAALNDGKKAITQEQFDLFAQGPFVETALKQLEGRKAPGIIQRWWEGL